MTVEDAMEAAKFYNENGRYNAEWFYYPAHHSEKKWFVARRTKDAEIYVAVYVDGQVSMLER